MLSHLILVYLTFNCSCHLSSKDTSKLITCNGGKKIDLNPIHHDTLSYFWKIQTIPVIELNV